MMSFYGYSLVFLCLIVCVCALPANGSTYDQRQTGDYNIHISLKDIKIVALLNGGLGGSEDYDYNYDYADMTIKPSPGENSNKTNATTVEPSSTKPTVSADDETTTEKVVEITPHSPTTKPNISNDIVIKNDTVLNKNKTEVKPIMKPVNHNIPVQIVLTPVEILSETPKPVTTTVALSTNTVETSTTKKVIKQANCIDGFVKDRQGNCRPRARKPPPQSLLRKLIQLSQRAQPPKVNSN